MRHFFVCVTFMRFDKEFIVIYLTKPQKDLFIFRMLRWLRFVSFLVLSSNESLFSTIVCNKTNMGQSIKGEKQIFPKHGLFFSSLFFVVNMHCVIPQGIEWFIEIIFTIYNCHEIQIDLFDCEKQKELLRKICHISHQRGFEAKNVFFFLKNSLEVCGNGNRFRSLMLIPTKRRNIYVGLSKEEEFF